MIPSHTGKSDYNSSFSHLEVKEISLHFYAMSHLSFDIVMLLESFLRCNRHKAGITDMLIKPGAS